MLSEVCGEYLPFLYFTKYIFIRVQFWGGWGCFLVFVLVWFFSLRGFCFAFFFFCGGDFVLLWIVVGLILWVLRVFLA